MNKIIGAVFFIFLLFPNLCLNAQDGSIGTKSSDSITIHFDENQDPEFLDLENAKVLLQIAGDIALIGAKVGVLEKKTPFDQYFIATDSYPMSLNLDFGWVLKVKTNLATITWKEELELPRMPLFWGKATDSEKLKVSPDQRISTMEHETTVQDGIVSNFWTTAFGDPTGDYKIRVWINGVFVKEFVFTFREK